MSLSNRDIQATILPLRLIFWGGLICIFDVTFSQTVNGVGWKIDIFNDFVGMLMITWSVFRLGRIRFSDRYRTAMLFVQIIAVLSCISALHDHLIYDIHPLVSLLLSILGMLSMLALVVFCLAMVWLCREAVLLRSEKSWRITLLLFVFIYLIPLGLFHFAAVIAFVADFSIYIDLGPAGLLLLPVFCIPIVFVFISTSRMKTDAESSIYSG